MSKLPPIIHLLTIWLSLLAAFLWLKTPALLPFSLQAFALAILLYFVLKRLASSKWHHLAPSPANLEMPLMTFALMLVVGSTGNTDSIVFPLAFLNLFFLILSTETLTATGSIAGLMLFHYALTPVSDAGLVADIFSLPLLGLIFFFSKHQHRELILAKKEEEELAIEKEKSEKQAESQQQMLKELSQIETAEKALLINLESFLSEFMQPKIEYLRELAQVAESRLVLTAQLEMLSERINQALDQHKTKAEDVQSAKKP